MLTKEADELCRQIEEWAAKRVDWCDKQGGGEAAMAYANVRNYCSALRTRHLLPHRFDVAL